MIPILILAALAFLGDRAMEYSLIQREAALTVVIVCVLALLVLVLLIYLNQTKKQERRWTKSDEQM